MTTIACWFNKESANAPISVWVCADSKVSNSAATTLFESSPKIFAIPVRCFVPGASGFFDRPLLNTTIGVAYAGNSLIGLTFISALSALLARLNGTISPPSLDEIAKFALQILQFYVLQLGFSFPNIAKCEVAIVGLCPVEYRSKIYHLTPGKELGKLRYCLVKYAEDQADDFVLLLGVDTPRIKESIQLVRINREKDLSWWRAPKDVISREVKTPLHATIGGHLQLGIGTHQGFELYSVAQRPDDGGGDFLSYLGLDVSGDFGRIGPCSVGMTGMS